MQSSSLNTINSRKNQTQDEWKQRYVTLIGRRLSRSHENVFYAQQQIICCDSSDAFTSSNKCIPMNDTSTYISRMINFHIFFYVCFFCLSIMFGRHPSAYSTQCFIVSLPLEICFFFFVSGMPCTLLAFVANFIVFELPWADHIFNRILYDL